MKPPTNLTEALALVPTHWPLTPGMDVWQDGDRIAEVGNIGQGREIFWDLVRPEEFGKLVPECDARRPIPQDVRESAAWWLLYNTLATINLPSFDQLYAQFIITKYGNDDLQLDVEPDSAINGMRSFNGESKAFAAIKALGGEQRIIKELSAGPDPLGRWILAGKP